MFIRLGGIFVLIGFVLWLWALFDAITTPADRVRNLPKLLWIASIVILYDVGAILWIVAGRPKATAGVPRARSVGGWTAGLGSVSTPRRSSPIAPDDDPDFLRKLDEQLQLHRPQLDKPPSRPQLDKPPSQPQLDAPPTRPQLEGPRAHDSEHPSGDQPSGDGPSDDHPAGDHPTEDGSGEPGAGR